MIFTREPFSSKIDLEAMENTIYIKSQPVTPILQPKFEADNSPNKAISNILGKDNEDSISAGEKS